MFNIKFCELDIPTFALTTHLLSITIDLDYNTQRICQTTAQSSQSSLSTSYVSVDKEKHFCLP